MRPGAQQQGAFARALLGATLAAASAMAGAADAPAAPADTVHGQQVYARCMACHALAYDRVGPRHCGLFGRRAGSVPGFAYSSAMKDSGITWDARTLEVFLRRPTAAVPGTSMTYDGVSDARDRADLIAYLRQAGRSSECRP